MCVQAPAHWQKGAFVGLGQAHLPKVVCVPVGGGAPDPFVALARLQDVRWMTGLGSGKKQPQGFPGIKCNLFVLALLHAVQLHAPYDIGNQQSDPVAAFELLKIPSRHKIDACARVQAEAEPAPSL